MAVAAHHVATVLIRHNDQQVLSLHRLPPGARPRYCNRAGQGGVDKLLYSILLYSNNARVERRQERWPKPIVSDRVRPAVRLDCQSSSVALGGLPRCEISRL